MKALVLLVLSSSLLIDCWTFPPSPLLLPNISQKVFRYPFLRHKLDKKKFVIPNYLSLAPSMHRGSYQLNENPLINTNILNVHKPIISLNDGNERHERLKWFYNNLAKKFKTKLLSEISKANYKQNPLKSHESDQTVPTSKQEDLSLVSGRRKFVDATIYGMDDPNNFYKVKIINHVTDSNDDNLDSGFDDHTDDSIKGYMETIDQNQNLPVLRYPSNYYDNILETVPQTQFGLLPAKYNKQPIYGVENTFKGFYDKIKYPYYKFVDFKNHLYGYDKQYNHEVENIRNWIIQIMSAYKQDNPLIIQIITDANDFDLEKLDKLDQSQLTKLSTSDLESLKTYFFLIINKYGITPYTYKLLEFINFLGGNPTHGSYLLYKILCNQRDVHSLSDEEMGEVKQHIEQILKEYGTSPYILPFLMNIEGIHFVPYNDEQFYAYDFDMYDSSKFLSKEDMMKIHLYFLKMYKNNPSIIRVLTNLNEIYEKSNPNAALPVLDVKDLENLSYINYQDLNLFKKYLDQIIKQRGDNTYVTQLFNFIKQLQDRIDKEKNIQIISHDQDFEKNLDLSGMFQYLRHLNKTGVTDSHIIDILKRFNVTSDMDISITTLNTTDFNKNDLIKIKQFLEHYYGEGKEKDDILSPIILDDTINIKFDDMQEILQYLLNQYNIIKSPNMIIILNLLRQVQSQPYGNGFVKVRFHDFEQIYNYLALAQEDTKNPTYIKMQYYVNETNKIKDIINPDFYDKIEIISDKVINLNEIYNFLIYKSKSEKVDPVLLEILQYLNTTFVLPNGELKIKIINLDNTGSFDGISPNDLHNLLIYIRKIQDNKVIFGEIFQYVKEKLYKEYMQNISMLSHASEDSLQRIKNFLLTFNKEHGESNEILQILLQINRILGVPDNDFNYVLVNGTDSKINDNDLDILTKYISSLVIPSSNSNLVVILKEISEYRDNIKEETEKNKQIAQMYFFEILNDEQVSPAIKNLIKIIYFDMNVDFAILNENEKKRLIALNSEDLGALYTYLKEFVNTFGSNRHIQQILVYIAKIRENKKIDDSKITVIDGTDSKDDNVIIITKDYFNIIKKHILNLINVYGKDPVIMQIIYVINNIEGAPDKGSEANDNVIYIKADDISVVKEYLLNLIQKHGINYDLIKTIRVCNKLYGGVVEETDRQIIQVNSTHTTIVVNQNDINRIKSYLIEITNNYGYNPFLMNILKEIKELDKETNDKLNVYNISFAKLSRNDFNQITQYIMEVIEKVGMRDELIDLLDFFYKIYGDLDDETKGNDEQFILEISKELKKLREIGVIKMMQDMGKVKLTSLYMKLLQNIFDGMSTRTSVELATILVKLIDIYKIETDSVNKYIILKLYEYLLTNKGTGYENFWKPEFIEVILEMKTDDSYPSNIRVPSDDNYFIVEPYDYSKDIETVLELIVNSTINNTWKTMYSDESIKKDLYDYMFFDNSEKDLYYTKIACRPAYNKLQNIWTVLNGAVNLQQVASDFTLADLNRIIDIFLIFKKKLSLQFNRDNIPTKVLINELEKILLSPELGKCEQPVDLTAFMTPVIESLRESILYMKLNHYSNDEIQRIVASTLEEDVLPELKYVTVTDCLVRTKKDLLNGLYNNIFKNDDDIGISSNEMKPKER